MTNRKYTDGITKNRFNKSAYLNRLPDEEWGLYLSGVDTILLGPCDEEEAEYRAEFHLRRIFGPVEDEWSEPTPGTHTLDLGRDSLILANIRGMGAQFKITAYVNHILYTLTMSPKPSIHETRKEAIAWLKEQVCSQ